MGRKRNPIENVNIVAFGHKGLCIGKTPSGEAVLVENVVPGDVITFQPRRKKKGMKLGHVAHFESESPHRIPPVCDHFDHCGGCSWLNYQYRAQCEQKHDIVTNAIRRIGDLPEVTIRPIIGGDPELYYRNKMDYTFANRRWLTPEEIEGSQPLDYEGLGFHKSGAFDKVIDLDTCHLQVNISNEIRNATKTWALDNGLTFYDHRNHEGQLRNLIIRTTRAGEVMVILVTATSKKDIIDSFGELLKTSFPQIHHLIWMVNQKKNDALFDIDFSIIFGSGYLTEKLGETQYKIGPKSFFQTNPYQAEKLFEEVRKAANLKKSDVLYDLYCGVGSIGLYLARYCDKIVGIEEIPEAIDDAKMNAALNKFDNATFHVGDVGNLLDTAFLETHGRADVVVTDPPRAGMHDHVVETLNSARVPKIVYVSCNPSTQARDLKNLSEVYQVEYVQPVDMFPQTNHVESIAVLKLKS